MKISFIQLHSLKSYLRWKWLPYFWDTLYQSFWLNRWISIKDNVSSTFRMANRKLSRAIGANLSNLNMVLMKLKANLTGFISGEYFWEKKNFTPILFLKNANIQPELQYAIPIFFIVFFDTLKLALIFDTTPLGIIGSSESAPFSIRDIEWYKRGWAKFLSK